MNGRILAAICWGVLASACASATLLWVAPVATLSAMVAVQSWIESADVSSDHAEPIAIALTFVTPVALIGCAVSVVMVLRTQRRAMDSHCRKCGYTLRGLSKPRCPECGEAI